VSRRAQTVLLLSAVTGALVGLSVAGFEWVTREQLFAWLLRQPKPVRAVAPLAGLVLAAAALRWLAGGAGPGTADEFIRNYHDTHQRLDTKPFLGRLLGGVATLGLGGAMGFEGPSMYIGATIGSTLQRRLSSLFSRDDAKVLLVAGAAAGVAAIFKAPATGAVFAIEVPYQDDTARRMLLPALTAAAVSYMTYVALLGTTPLLPVRAGNPAFDLRDLGGAVLIGLLAGVGARAFAVVIKWAKRLTASVGAPVRIVLAGGAMAALFALSEGLFHEGLTLGSGYRTVAWSTDPRHGIGLVMALFLLRGVATVATVAGGGVGGLFIPLVVEGALLGRAVGGAFGTAGTSLFPVIGIAAFLGAGYRTPLAGVMFVAESTGRPGFVVPGLIAAVVAQLAMGKQSVSPYQQAARAGHLERRFALPLTVAIQTDVLTAPPDATLTEFVWNHLLATRQRSVPVVDGTRYLGMARMAELHDVAQDQWDATTVADIMRTDVPVGRIGWRLRDAVLAMEAADVDRLPVCDAEGNFIGVVATSEILKLDDILEQAGDEGQS
jgi:chloride channel protein, CIC family